MDWSLNQSTNPQEALRGGHSTIHPRSKHARLWSPSSEQVERWFRSLLILQFSSRSDGGGGQGVEEPLTRAPLAFPAAGGGT